MNKIKPKLDEPKAEGIQTRDDGWREWIAEKENRIRPVLTQENCYEQGFKYDEISRRFL